MNKTLLVLGLVAVVVLVGGYLGRHKIKAMLMGAPAQPVAMTATDTPVSSSPTVAAMMTVENTYLKTSSTGFLTDTKSMTLYTFDKDVVNSNKSACTGVCVKTWPAYTTTTNTGLPDGVTAFQRTDDKTWQLAYKGWPLYHYATDAKVGDTMGDGVGGIWHIVKP